ncbi:MAG: helix-turn-helix domain-containing protein [Euryarchaeota archaeon]|nr:helix-turn-helix domain-containing protein [Euryarchaeota archaeon]
MELRRLVVSLPPGQWDERWLHSVTRWGEVRSLHVLKYDEREVTAVVDLRPPGPGFDPRRLVDRETVLRCELLSRDPGGGVTCLMRLRHRAVPLYRLVLRRTDLSFDPLLEVREGEMRVSIRGSTEGLQRLIREADRIGFRWRIVRFSAADFTRSTILESLTPRQREALRLAHRLGYYEKPKRVRLAKLAEILGVAKPTAMEHLRLAEKKVLDSIL